MKTIISATLLAMSLSTAALAQAPMSAGSAEIFTRLGVLLMIALAFGLVAELLARLPQ